MSLVKSEMRECFTALAGGIGDGFGMGASNCSDGVIVATAGGIGDGFGIGASNVVTGPATWDFRSGRELWRPEVPVVKFSGERSRELASELVPNRANASMITDKLRLISC